MSATDETTMDYAHADYDAKDALFAQDNQAFNESVKAAVEESAWTPLMARVKAVVEREIDNTIAMIHSEAVVSHPNPREAGSENYGIAGRAGVRRETYVDQPRTQPEAQGGMRQEDLLAIVAEFRSSLAMKQYFDRQG